MNELQHRLIKFSVSVFNETEQYYQKASLKPLLVQLNRSASSIGANYSEAQSAGSKRDFHNKIRIALKEARETEYWLEILHQKLDPQKSFKLILEETTTIIKILTVIARKTDPNKNHI